MIEDERGEVVADVGKPIARRGKSKLFIGVAIATAGRAKILGEAIAELSRQSRLADKICVCAPHAADVIGIELTDTSIFIAHGSRGSCIQRNIIIDNMSEMDVILFIDDDFFLAKDYLERIEYLFLNDPDIVLATGLVLADGVLGPGLSVSDARIILANDQTPSLGLTTPEAVYNGYGCNMAVRAALLRKHLIRFDESLPLYGWLEDVDFSRRLAAYGKVVKTVEARGVHLGHKGGRQRGVLLGYSQIANPVYLARKGTLSWPRALKQIMRNMCANAVKSLMPEPYIDRRGRLGGHMRAFLDLVLGRLHPRRVLEL